MKSKVVQTFDNVSKKVSVGLTTLTTARLMFLANIASADAAGELLSAILELLCKLLIPFGVILGIMGIVHFASSKSEGDGPASNKAIGQIAAGVMLVVLSIVLLTMKDKFTSLLTAT